MEQVITDDPYITKLGTRNYLVDQQNNRVQFLDNRFYRDAESGEFFPSVTTILNAYPKGAQFYEWLKKHGEDSDTIRDEAGERGSVVHKLTEDFDAGLPIEMMTDDGKPKYNMGEWDMLRKYVEFTEMFPAKVLASELNLASKALGYGGTLDRVMTFEHDGVTRLVDIKTSGSIWPSFWLQLSAYNELLKDAHLVEDKPMVLSVLWLNSKHRGPAKGKIQGQGWSLIDQSDPTEHYLDLFNKTRALWLAENGAMKPRMTSYQLSYRRK